VEVEEEVLSQGVGRKAPRMMRRGEEDDGRGEEAVVLPLTRRMVGACQDITWREKELREVPWVVVEYSGWKRAFEWKMVGMMPVDAGTTERKVERCDRRVCVRRAAVWFGFGGLARIGETLIGIVFCIEGAAAPRCFDKSKVLLKRKCSNCALRGSNR
jgi:hypothetical protein